MAMAEGDVIRYEKLNQLPIEDFLIKADSYTQGLRARIEHERDMESRAAKAQRATRKT